MVCLLGLLARHACLARLDLARFVRVVACPARSVGWHGLLARSAVLPGFVLGLLGVLGLGCSLGLHMLECVNMPLPER